MEINESNLPIMETFYSIQGEGFHSGKPAYFIRLGGCDVGCHWCDVKESWDHGDHKIISVDKIVSEVECQNGIVIVTGGEPLMWDMNILTSKLKENNNIVHLEIVCFDLEISFLQIKVNLKKEEEQYKRKKKK